jgi:hypothetical protein
VARALLKKYSLIIGVALMGWGVWVLVGIGVVYESRNDINKLIINSVPIDSAELDNLFRYDVETYGLLHKPKLTNIMLDLNKIVGWGGIAKIDSMKTEFISSEVLFIEMVDIDIEGIHFNKVSIKSICKHECLYYIVIITNNAVLRFKATENTIFKIINSKSIGYESIFRMLENSGEGYNFEINSKNDIKFQTKKYKTLNELKIKRILINKEVGNGSEYGWKMSGKDLLVEFAGTIDDNLFRNINLSVDWGRESNIKEIYCSVKGFCKNKIPDRSLLRSGFLGKIYAYLVENNYNKEEIGDRLIGFINNPGTILIEDDPEVGDFEPKRVVFKVEYGGQ